ncbi:hypothetical protein ACFSCX_22925 [Bacillus salitolerans]|uniref:Uncharacterized protein n=1 Tax=Bacillus salitolerans TaxID=1437434 RepID=A0ABW4LVX8_9BACI
MKNDNRDSFELYYDEVGEKELTQQLTDAYQSGFDYTVNQENDPQYEER